jgi:hypothetical protein
MNLMHFIKIFYHLVIIIYNLIVLYHHYVEEKILINLTNQALFLFVILLWVRILSILLFWILPEFLIVIYK